MTIFLIVLIRLRSDIITSTLILEYLLMVKVNIQIQLHRLTVKLIFGHSSQFVLSIRDEARQRRVILAALLFFFLRRYIPRIVHR